MPRPRQRARRHRRARALVWAAALAAASGCADERRPPEGCADCGIHPAGILDPDSSDFHGAELARRDWDFALCASCHGSDFAGGAAGVSCVECHEDGPTSCGTCHAERPDTGSHPAHLGLTGAPPDESRAWDCAECHVVPERWDDEGHILRGGEADPGPAEVTFPEDGQAALTPAFAARSEPPTYDPSTGRCSGVYCHGDLLTDGGAALTEPSWSAAGEGQAACGTCHGNPPASHTGGACESCHPTGAAAHIDGVLSVGSGDGCTGCHGSAGDPAPPRDLSGDELTAALGVGAHQSHLDATLRLRGPLACGDCHAVPASVTAAGHIDTPPPAEVALTGGGEWDRAAATCTTWCHGGARPVWTRVGLGEAACGTCHGIPPDTASHSPDLDLTDCVQCHAATVDAFGNILRTGAPGAETSEHMDGQVDID